MCMYLVKILVYVLILSRDMVTTRSEKAHILTGEYIKYFTYLITNTFCAKQI